jgi:hypothetical protein
MVKVPLCSWCYAHPWGTCSSRGRRAPLYGRRQRLPLVCGLCWQSVRGRCRICRSITHLLPNSDDEYTQCEKCYSPTHRRCGSCGQTKHRIKLLGTHGQPDLCDYCWRGPRTECVLCKRLRKCPTGYRAGAPACATCVPRRPQTCSDCGCERIIYAVDNRDLLCSPCHRRRHPKYADPDTRPRASGASADQLPTPASLRRPRGWQTEYGCHDWQSIWPRYVYGRCPRCAVAAVFDVLTPDPHAAHVLEPLREAMVTGPSPGA